MPASEDTDPSSNHHDVELADDRQPVSSDLDDCGDLWNDDLELYKRYTMKHQQQLDKWFETSIIVRALSFSLSFSLVLTKVSHRIRML